MKRLLTFVLACLMFSACLVSCGGGDGGNVDGGELVDGNWAGLDFGDATLRISVSVNDPEQVTFKNAGLYTKGPDKATTETVQKKVLARNKKVADDMNMKVEFQPTDWAVDEVLEHVDRLVTGAADDAPDIYNNDILPLSSAMLNGYLLNAADPGTDKKGNPIRTYFDFNKECWYGEYMKGATLDADKLYLLVGDYNIDIIRFAWVFFVNKDLWDGAYAQTEYGTYENMCEYIADTEDWFYDDVIALAALGHRDSTTGTMDKTDKTDDQIGLCINSVAPRIFVWGSGVSVYEWTKNGKACAPGEGTPSLIPITDITPLVSLGNKYTELYNAKGVLANGIAVKDSTTMFMDGKIIMSMAELGEMESEEMRNTKFARGILPFPRYKREYTDGLNTVVHDQAEVTAILNTAESFSMASAYMQYINEQSVEILDTYYEEVLKFKYNESKGAREMIDMVHGSINSPFDSVMSIQLYNRAIGDNIHFWSSFQNDAVMNRASTFSSTYGSMRGTLHTMLTTMLKDFEEMP